jgi:hypothetical protein
VQTFFPTMAKNRLQTAWSPAAASRTTAFSRLPKKLLLERFVTGQDFSRADKPFIFLPEPALAGGTGHYFDFFRGLLRCDLPRPVTSRSPTAAAQSAGACHSEEVPVFAES